MSILKRAAAALLATTAVVAIASTAQAQTFKGKSAGDIIVRARGLAVMPDEKADVKTGGTKLGEASVNNDYIPEVDFSYFVTDNIALELIAGTSRHTVKTSLPAAVGGSVDVGKVSLLPPTLTAQYHFMPKSQVSPYIGAGINYTLFYNEDAARRTNGVGLSVTSTDYKNRFGWALQAGVDVFLTDNVLLNLDVKKLFLSTKLNAMTNVGLPVTSNVRLDPWIVGVGVGYKF
jgi:outer membrane protein